MSCLTQYSLAFLRRALFITRINCSLHITVIISHGMKGISAWRWSLEQIEFIIIAAAFVVAVLLMLLQIAPLIYD